MKILKYKINNCNFIYLNRLLVIIVMNVLKMIKLEFTTDQVNAIIYNAYNHHHPHVQRKMNALSMKNIGIHNKKINYVVKFILLLNKG